MSNDYVFKELRVLAERRDYGHHIAFLLRANAGDKYAYCESVSMETKPEGFCPDPTFCLSLTAAQELMDNLWQCGLRPSEGTGSAGALAATEKHLEDMRRLVFHGKEKENKGTIG